MDNANGYVLPDEELELRTLVKLVGRGWRMILLFSLLGGLIAGVFFVIKQVNYVATATVAVDTEILALKTSPTFLLLNKEIKSEVAREINSKVLENSDVLITAEKNDKTVYYISAISTSPEQAIKIANLWSEKSIAWIQEVINRIENDVDDAKEQVAKSNNALTSYLNKNKLTSLTWNDLVILTGSGMSGTFVTVQPNDSLPIITQYQQAELSDLIIQKISAEWNYERILKDVLERNYQITDRVKIIEYADEAKPASFLDSRLLIPVGVFIGFLFSLVWIILKHWWNCYPTSIIPPQGNCESENFISK